MHFPFSSGVQIVTKSSLGQIVPFLRSVVDNDKEAHNIHAV